MAEEAVNKLPGTAPLNELTDQLHERRSRAKLGGGLAKIEAQHERGKLTAHERLDLLVDPGTFNEIGIHGRSHYSQPALKDKEAPADGVITGWGDIEGRTCAIVAYDFTVMAGSMGQTGEVKVTRIREMALQKRMPLVWLLDSAGARIQEAAGSLFAGIRPPLPAKRSRCREWSRWSPMMGPRAAGTAYIPGLSDFVPMVVGQGAMALAGPHLVKAVTGEEIDMEDLGGAKVHCRKSGVGDPRSPTTPNASSRSRSTSRTSRRTARRSPRSANAPTPRTAAPTSCSRSSPSPRAPRTTCTR